MLSADRVTIRRDHNELAVLLAAAAQVFQGGLVCINASGYGLAAAATLGLKTAGVAIEPKDNSDGDNGDLAVIVRRGMELHLKNSGIVQADVGKKAYVSDDETVCASVSGTAVAAEVVGAGSGTAKVFELVLANGKIEPGTVTIDATVGAAGVEMVDDGNGRIAGTGVGKGHIDYDSGFVHLEFTTAPDNATNVTADYEHSAPKVEVGIITEIDSDGVWVHID